MWVLAESIHSTDPMSPSFFDVDICDVPNVASACNLLYNICEIHREAFNEEWLGVESVAQLDVCLAIKYCC